MRINKTTGKITVGKAVAKLYFFCIACCLLLGCASSKPKPPAFTAKPAAGNISIKFYEVPEGYHGTWVGDFPCDNCSGIKFTLTLNPDYTFSSSAIKEGVIEKPVEMSGVYIMRNNTMLTLVHQGQEIQQLAISPDMLLLLNKDAEPINKDLTDSYFLVRINPANTRFDSTTQSAPKLPLQSSWKLISLDGFAIKGNYALGKDPTLTLDLETKRGKGYSGCNNFGFRLTSEFNYLTFHYIVLQENTCLTEQVENDYIFYLQQSPFQYQIVGDRMFLRSARGYVLEFKAAKK